MKCPLCGKNDFGNVTLMSENDCYKGGNSSNYIFAEAKLMEFPKGDIEDSFDRSRNGNWSLNSKVCMGCGYIAMFLPLSKMRRRKKAKESAAKKKREAEAAAKKKREAETAARNKKAKEAEKERLKKRLAELEDSE